MNAGDDDSRIRALVARWMDASRAGDTAAVLAMMTADVVFLVPGQAPFGKAEFARASAGQAEAGLRIDGRSEILDLQVLGDWAFTISRLQVSVASPAGTPMQRAGHTLTLFRREQGEWRLARDANLLVPVPAAGD
jgi:uncharacterized protein (TIGR02246 family)